MDKELFADLVRRWVLCFLLLLLGLVLSLPAHGQNGGVVAIATKEVQVFSAQAATASSGGTWQCLGATTPIPCPYLPDPGGNACSFLTYSTSAFQGTIDLEWSPTGSAPYFSLVQGDYPTTADTAIHILQLGGYFPNLRSTVTPTTGSLSAWFTSSAAPCPLVPTGLGSNGPSAPINCDQLAIGTVPTGNSTQLVGPSQSGDSIVVCGFTVSFNGATSAGTFAITFEGVSGSCSLTGNIGWEIYTTSSTPQVIPVSQVLRTQNLATQYLCTRNNSGVGAIVSFSYASVHGL